MGLCWDVLVLWASPTFRRRLHSLFAAACADVGFAVFLLRSIILME